MPFGLAIVGVGYWGPNWVRVASEHPDIDLKVVCDLSPGRRAYIRERYPGISVSADINRLLTDSSIDGAILVTPLSTHEDPGLKILRAGKHLLIEKPLATTSDGAQRLVSAALKSKVVLAVGHIFAYHPGVSKLVRELSDGSIGEMLYAQSQRMNLGPPDPNVDVVWDLAVHDLAIMYEIHGVNPAAVRAVGGKYTHGDLTDIAFINSRYADGSMASHQVGWHAAEKKREFYVAGSTGSMRFDDSLVNDKLKIYGSGVDNRTADNLDNTGELTYGSGQIRGVPLDEVEPLRQQCDEFVSAMFGGPPPTADGKAGLAVVSVLEAIERSISSDGRIIEVPFDGFNGDVHH